MSFSSGAALINAFSSFSVMLTLASFRKFSALCELSGIFGKFELVADSGLWSLLLSICIFEIVRERITKYKQTKLVLFSKELPTFKVILKLNHQF
ncbi:hypothetical protein BpHYR1_030523 [Brachionus plicatilis]|uniref:Uncharacterized protein n=1 Tax=Brachionus plicatilis TaxID=10195 RepID=A0A3M7PJ69_BRAPC|nr:hypothetical protein BpHYR1_030523 [Brachionus plicatilis]